MIFFPAGKEGQYTLRGDRFKLWTLCLTQNQFDMVLTWKQRDLQRPTSLSGKVFCCFIEKTYWLINDQDVMLKEILVLNTLTSFLFPVDTLGSCACIFNVQVRVFCCCFLSRVNPRNNTGCLGFVWNVLTMDWNGDVLKHFIMLNNK